ncbi:hypothetical protein TRFO_16917 [Tritrichomonas foetus]|uniref:Beige/BEACH domain containing protein n=1 Tax=Tritrichomonas foetus TaxID=1144522 RepID=A0A1J4KP11_9EUKA|nr:hypothetical protein TRFO_16917 [Tritrichomonas foetus]|eukprot:OHT12971.1 hypothetical protein TRFO_16917 [Tritrichomonas foetus]
MVNSLNFKIYTQKELYENDDKLDNDNEQYLIHFFKLDEEIHNSFWDFVIFFIENRHKIKHIPKVMDLMTVLTYRFLIQYDILFQKFFKAVLSNHENTDFFLNCQLIIPLVYSLPSDCIRTALNIISNFTFDLTQIFLAPSLVVTKPFINAIINTTLDGCLSIFSDSTQMKVIHFPVIQIILVYFYSHWPLIGTNNISDDGLQNINKITNFILKIPPSLISVDMENFTNLIIKNSYQCLDLISKTEISKSQINHVFEIGISIIKILTFFSRINNDLKSKIANDEHKITILLFILWTLDNFPLTDFKFDEDLHSKDENKSYKTNQTNISMKNLTNFEFINENTFSEPFYINDIENEKINDYSNQRKGRILNMSSVGDINKQLWKVSVIQERDYIKENCDLSKYFKMQHTELFTAIRLLFAQLLENSAFVNSFVISYFQIMNKLFDFDGDKTNIIEDKQLDISHMFHIDEHCLTLSLQFFIILLFSQFESKNIKKAVSSTNKGWPTIFHYFFFSPKINHWANPSPYFCFCFDIRSIIYKFTVRCFSLSKENEQLFNTLYNLFVLSEPQVFEESIHLFKQLFKINPVYFVEASSKTGIIEMFICQSIKLQNLHINLIKANAQDIDKVRRTRIYLFDFFDLFLTDLVSASYFFKLPFFSKFVISLLFEKNIATFATNLLQRGILLQNLTEIFKNLQFMFQTCLKEMHDLKWIKMINILLENTQNAFNLNRPRIMKQMKEQNILLQISQFPNAVVLANPNEFTNESIDPNSEYSKLIQNVLYVILVLSHGNQEYQIYITSTESLLDNISKALSKIVFGEDILNLLLELVFEQKMDVNNLPTRANIQNHFALPFFFNSTKHLEIHGNLMSFLSRVCIDSVSNRLRIYQANLQNIIIDWLSKFPAENKISPSRARSLTESLNLFSVVSQYVFSVSTLYKCIRILKPINSESRMWWTNYLISLFSTYIENSKEASPTAFFYMDGFRSGFDLPVIPFNKIFKGFTFICRIMLDSCEKSGKLKYSTLLYMESMSNVAMEILFVDTKLKISTFSEKHPKYNFECFIDDFDFQGNTWYDLIISFSKFDCTLYINGYKVFFRQMKIPFKNDIINTVIANNKSKNSQLVGNISCFYFLSGVVDNSIAYAFHSLPKDFVFGFSSSELQLYSGLPLQLFNGEIESALFIGANARMATQNECFNFSTQNSIGNAKFKGYAFPFSVSFIDIVAYSGGVKLFLPLFEQVNSRIYEASRKEDNVQFLQNLIALFANFFTHSLSLEKEFVKDKGFNAISYLLTKINPNFINRSILLELVSLWNRINKVHYESMITSVWLNFTLWDTLTFDSQQFFYTRVLITLIEENQILFSKKLFICEFMSVIARQTNKDIRAVMWPIVISLARTIFPEDDQDCLFSACFSCRSIEFQLESLTIMYQLTSEQLHNCHFLFLRNGSYSPFLQLLHSPREDIRVWGLKFLFMINSFHICNEISFDKIIYRASLEIEPANFTSKTWDTLISITFDCNNIILASIEFTLPLLCSYSHYFLIDQIENFINRLSKSNNFHFITKCKNWYFWLFYLYNQLSLPFDSNHAYFNLFADVCANLALNEQYTMFNNSMAFLTYLLVQARLNTTMIISRILEKIMFAATATQVSPQLYTLIVQYVIHHLFFISKKESYSSNVQLYFKHDIQMCETLNLSISGHQSLEQFLGMFTECIVLPYTFSARIDHKGEWNDYNLALSFIDFMCRIADLSTINNKTPMQSPFVRFPKISSADLIAYVSGFIIKSNPSQASYVNLKINHFFGITENANTSNSLNLYNSVSNNYNNSYKILNCMLHKDNSDSFAKWLEIFQSLCGYYFDIAKNQISALWTQLNPMMQSLSKGAADEFDYYLFLENCITQIQTRQKRANLISQKIASHLKGKISSNGGPWADHNATIHWKYSRKIDAFKRHILMKPNYNFNDHVGAALKRDQSLNQIARLEYERWIETQPQRQTEEEEEIEENKHVKNQGDDAKNSAHQIISDIDAEAKLITIASVYEGTFYISNKQICFTGTKISDEYGYSIGNSNSKTIQIDLDGLIWVLHRSYLHMDHGLEFFFSNGMSYFFFFSGKVRNSIIRFLSFKKIEIVQNCDSMKLISDQKITEKWQNGSISTYEYIMLLNFFSGRTFNDLSQYPVFPWIIADYESEKLDLSKQSTYRDLSKPIGALNEQRLQKLKKEYEECPDPYSKCLYRCHYSTAYNVLHFMIRVEPFTTMHIQMQDGKFDSPNRLFTSIPKSYRACTSTLHDFRELIPEFFTLPDFLINKDKFNLACADGNDVTLPKWALNPADFISKHREALESEYVGQNINKWIDLIFGCKQTGKAAEEANNTFHSFCYEGIITKDVLNNPSKLLEIQRHAGSFGITPRQLFVTPHPPRLSIKIPRFFPAPMFSVKYDTGCKIVSINSIGDEMQVLTIDRNLLILKTEKNAQCELISKIQVPFYLGSNRCTCYFAKHNIFAAISPPEDSFHAYGLDQSNFSHLFSFRQKFSSPLSACAAGDNTLMLLSQDGSINVWEIRNSSKSIIQKYRRNHHFVSTTDAYGNGNIGLIASCDLTKRVVLTDLATGSFIRSWYITDPSLIPQRVMLFDSGFVSILCEIISQNDKRTVIQTFSLDAEIVGAYDHIGQMCSWIPLNFRNGTSYVALSYEDCNFVILHIPDLKIALSVSFKNMITGISFNNESQELFLSDSHGKVFLANI